MIWYRWCWWWWRFWMMMMIDDDEDDEHHTFIFILSVVSSLQRIVMMMMMIIIHLYLYYMLSHNLSSSSFLSHHHFKGSVPMIGYQFKMLWNILTSKYVLSPFLTNNTVNVTVILIQISICRVFMEWYLNLIVSDCLILNLKGCRSLYDICAVIVTVIVVYCFFLW